MDIGTKIKKLRESKSLSQADLATELGISQAQLCKMESSQVEKIDFVLMHKICDFFNMDFQYFLEDSFSQTNQDNKNSAISIFGNPIVHNYLPEDIVETIIKNQEQITSLMETQSKLIDSLRKDTKI